MERLRAGQPTEREEFVRDHYRGLYRWLCRLTGCPDQAADLTQESFVAFLESLRRTSPRGSLRAWLYAIAKNQWRKQCRSRGLCSNQADGCLDQIAAPDAPPQAAMEREEFVERLRSVVLELPPEYREVFSLRVWQEFDYSEIAAIQDIGTDLARWRFFRARQMIRARMKVWNEV